MVANVDGTEARVGHRVDYDGTPAAVAEVIDTPAQRAARGLADSGLLLQEREGRVFERSGSCGRAPAAFLGRAGRGPSK
jgi:hypothetical protein